MKTWKGGTTCTLRNFQVEGAGKYAGKPKIQFFRMELGVHAKMFCPRLSL